MDQQAVQTGPGAWPRTTLDTLLRWGPTFWATVTPDRLTPPFSGLNPPGRQVLVAAITLGLVQALTGLDITPIDGAFELPPAFGWLQWILRTVPGATLLLAAAVVVVTAAPTWLFWRLMDRRARFSAVLQAQAYVIAMLIPFLILTIALKAALATRLIDVGGEAVGLLAVGVVLWATVWVARLTPRLVGAPMWRFAVALVLGIAVTTALSVLSPLPWPPRKEFAVSSAAMEPTAGRGDQLAANLWAYHWREPRRGELVIYRVRGVGRLGRIIGLPGETVAVQEGQVSVNGRPLALQPFGQPGMMSNGGWPVQGRRYIETTPEGRRYLIQSLDGFSMADNFGPQAMPAGHYLILGDNRDNAADSRFSPPEGPGFVPRVDLVGPLYRRTFPLGRPLDALAAPPAARRGG